MQGFKFLNTANFLVLPCSNLKTISQQVAYYQSNSDKLQKIILFLKNSTPITISLLIGIFFTEFGQTW